jgi:3,4-dihydroxy 2-butanone 4-phosphate synthase
VSIIDAIENFRKGKPILIYDFESREGETDIAIPALHVDHRDVSMMRKDAGGLICVSVSYEAGEALGLPFISDLYSSLNSEYATVKRLVEREGDIRYDRRSSFSLWVNHRDTFTGITDMDRSLTIRKIGEAVKEVLNGRSYDFAREFRTPGHVAILKASKRLLDERVGQTELSIALADMAGIPPAVVICEMLDDVTGKALPKEKAKEYGVYKGIPFVEGKEIVKAYNAYLLKYIEK